MERISHILGLVIHNGKIQDRFAMAFINALNRVVDKLMNSFENLGEEEREIDPLEKRKEGVLDKTENQTYREALRILVKLRPEYKKYLPGRSKGSLSLAGFLKRKIRLIVWTGTGNKIPFKELNEAMLKKFIKAKGYIYRRKAGEMGWYRGDLFVGENLFHALEHLEKVEAVDRSRLTISF